MKTQKLYFLTYGTKNFDISAKHIIKLAEKSNFFEKCIYMKPNDIDYNFKKKYEPIFSSPRGAGFWIWKHKIIKDCLDSIGDGDIVVYSDTVSSSKCWISCGSFDSTKQSVLIKFELLSN